MTEMISAIVVSYNSGTILGECVDSLLACPITSEKALPTIWRKPSKIPAKRRLTNAEIWRVLGSVCG